jgi:hypothetical protein
LVTFSIEFQKHVAPSIQRLLFRGRPVAIPFAVMSVVIFTLDLQSFSVSWSHVLSKFLVVDPKNLNVASTPTVKVLVIRVLAPLLYSTPNDVEMILFSLSGIAVLGVQPDPLGAVFISQTTTRGSVPGFYIWQQGFCVLSAITPEQPYRLPLSRLKNSPTSETDCG